MMDLTMFITKLINKCHFIAQAYQYSKAISQLQQIKLILCAALNMILVK